MPSWLLPLTMMPPRILHFNEKKMLQQGQMIYFILSSEIMENISEIKVVSIYSDMIWYHFTVN